MFGEEKKRLDLICEESSSKRVCVRTRACVLQRERKKERFERERERDLQGKSARADA